MYMLECVHVFIITAAAALLPLAPQANINSSAALLLSRIQPAASQNLSQIGRPASSRIDRPASRIRSMRSDQGMQCVSDSDFGEGLIIQYM